MTEEDIRVTHQGADYCYPSSVQEMRDTAVWRCREHTTAEHEADRGIMMFFDE